MHDFLPNLALVLATAAVTTVVCQWLRLPVVFGYLLAGVAIGPHIGLPLVADEALVDTLAELGVILLMFAIGLEFSLGRLLRLGLTAGFTAVVEIGISFWLGFLAARLAGLPVTAALFIGGALCISSTTIIAREFAERPPERELRDRIFGILLVEDLVAVVLLAVLTAVGAGRGLSLAEVGDVSTRLAAFLLALVLGGLLVVPRLFRAVQRLRRAETLLVAGVGLCFAVALLAQRFGYSVALGGFIAGMLIAEAGRTYELEKLVRPLRDLFAAIFFVAVGMMIVPEAVSVHWRLVLGLTLLVIVAKFTGLTLGVFLTGGGLRRAVQAGMTMGQIGEFSFIIAGVGRAAGVLDSALYSVIVAVSALTILLTPAAIAVSKRTAAFIDGALPTAVQNFLALDGSWVAAGGSATGLAGKCRTLGGIIILDALALAAMVVGAALAWPNLTGALLATGLPPQAEYGMAALCAALVAVFALGIAVNAKKLALVLANGCLPLAGNLLPQAEAPRRALVTMLHAAVVLVVMLPLLALVQPFVPPVYGTLVVVLMLAPGVVVFWRRTVDLQAHLAAGAQAISEALLHRARMVHGGRASEDEALAAVRAVLPGIGDPVAVRLQERDHAVGKSLAELNLRGRTDATVLAIVHSERGVAIPSGREPLGVGDTLALAGTAVAVQAARDLLRRGETTD